MMENHNFPPRQARLLRHNLLKWYQPHHRNLPWRALWQKYRNPYHVWVSEIMLQQTTIKAVLLVYSKFLNRFPTISKLANAEEEDVRLAVRGLGYYRRFSNMHRAAKEITDERQGKFPKTYDELLELPGIGPYTASAIASIAFNEAHAVVDGNTERILCRVFDIRQPSNSPKLKPYFRKWAAQLLDHENPGDFNQAFMELGQLVCRPGEPDCEICPFTKVCLARKNQSQLLAPAPKIKKPSQSLDLQLTIFVQKNKIGIVQRAETDKFLKSTWGFATILGKNTSKQKSTRIGQVKHNITHHQINAGVWIDEQTKSKNIRWFSPDKIEENLVSNLDRKALKLFFRFAGSQELVH